MIERCKELYGQVFFLFFFKDTEVEDPAATSTVPPSVGVKGINRQQGEISILVA